MKSVFTFWAYFVGLYALIFCCMLFAGIVTVIYYRLTPVLFFVFIILVIAFVCTWTVSGELRQKVVRIVIAFDHIEVKRYLGLGPSTIIYFKQLDGFRVSVLPARGGTYEYLYLMTGNKKIVKLSQFYHRNYTDLKQMLSENLTDLGFEYFNYNQEFKEIFT